MFNSCKYVKISMKGVDKLNFYCNPNKNVEVTIRSNTFLRHAIKTHFVQPNESYLDIMKTYVEPISQEGDIVFISEKIIALCQNRIVYKKDIKVGFFAKFLSKFVNVTPAGESVGNPYKMQLAINQAGLFRILVAAGAGAIGKVFKKKGLFYIVAGNGINGIDGFCDDAFSEYLELGILNPINCNEVCNEIHNLFKVHVVIVDANDLGVEILGCNKDIYIKHNDLIQMIKDNPAGQGNQSTPIILARLSTLNVDN